MRSKRFGFAPALLSGLLISTGSLVPARAQDNPYDTVVDARMGRRVFYAECGRCHGRDAKGNEETGAPDLTTGSFANASTDAGLFDVIQNGIPGTTMIGIGWASEPTIWQVVAYLKTLNPNPADYDLPGNIERGRELFRGKGNCTSCHMVNGVGGRLGPDLSTVGNRRTPEELETDLTKPDESVEPRWWTLRVTRADGSVIEGLRMNEDTFSLRIMDADENLWHFAKSEIRTAERNESSTMPSAMETLNAEDVDDLVAYLFSLRKES